VYWVLLEFSGNFDGLLMESEEWRCGASKSIRATVVTSVFCLRDCLVVVAFVVVVVVL
jgi:hypothetical protein